MKKGAAANNYVKTEAEDDTKENGNSSLHSHDAAILSIQGVYNFLDAKDFKVFCSLLLSIAVNIAEF